MSRTKPLHSGAVATRHADFKGDEPMTTAAPAPIKNPLPPDRQTPDRFTYGLKAYTTQRRKDGWWIARTPVMAAGDKIEWHGPFANIETACLAIARYLATELANRHTVQIGFYRLTPDDPLYGLKPTTRLAKTRTGSRTL